MLAMKPIDEPDVVDLLNNGRFAGEVEGYIMMDGPAYCGHALFVVENGVTRVLDSGVDDFTMLDGIVRACIAAGDNRGAKEFAVNREHDALNRWWNQFCAEMPEPVSVDHIFHFC